MTSDAPIPQKPIRDRPIVLLGCSGAGKELFRLGSSLVESLSPSKSRAEQVLEELSEDEIPEEDEEDAGVVEVIYTDSNGHFVLTPTDLQNLISSEKVSNRDVIVLDYSHPVMSMEEERYKNSLVQALNALAEYLYKEMECLCIYINAHPERSEMNPTSREIQSLLESSVFLPLTDYEIVVEDEGLDPVTIMIRENLDESLNTRNYASFESALEDVEASSEVLEEQKKNWEHVTWELRRVVAQAMMDQPIPSSEQLLLGGRDTFFLSLSFPKIEEVTPYIENLCADHDAMEFRTDLLSCSRLESPRREVLHSLQYLRKICRPYTIRSSLLGFGGNLLLEDVMPIVYTVRTKNQAGTWEDASPSSIEQMFDLLKLGLRNGVEVLDVESAWDEHLPALLRSYERRGYTSLLLGSHHLLKETSMDHAVQLFHQCTLGGKAHGAKLVLSIDDESKDRMAYEAAQKASLSIPHIGLILGKQGQYSRVLNRAFTPVTHPSLPNPAAPGQLSTEEIMKLRLEDKILQPKTYCILGYNIAYSVSPQMHNAAYEACGLPHEYTRMDVETVEEFIESDLFQSEGFGGASVTIPHKQSIMEYVDELTPAAKEIGSMNTVIVQHTPDGRRLLGDNTDWKGIVNPLQRRLSSSRGYALILGGGGTARAAAYSAKYLGLEILYWNRTPGKVRDLAESFGGVVLEDLEDLREGGYEIDVVISTLPAGVGFELPQFVLEENKPIIFDVNYKPYYTKLLFQAERSGCQVVRGSEMLWEQGVGQFELWMGRYAPYKVMKDVVLENCLPEDEGEGEEDSKEK